MKPTKARSGKEVEQIKRDILENLSNRQGKFPDVATPNDWYLAVAYTVRDRLLNRWVKSAHQYYENKSRTVCYLSAEFLIGPQLGMNLLRLKAYDEFREAVKELGPDLDELIAHEEEPGLGNGGLGRLAACYMESLATLEVPSIGYGIRYEFGIFDQEFRNRWQVETADRWLRYGNPWEIARPDIRFEVKFGGRTESFVDKDGKYRVLWIPDYEVTGTPCDTVVLGYGVESANFLRLWKAEAHVSFDFQAFNAGDYHGAVNKKVDSENITKVLYPNDEQMKGRELRLKQQYFFVSCSLQDMIRLHLQKEGTQLDAFHLKYAVQLNDTHPTLAIPELMRLLVDEFFMDWETAWDITQRTFGYTNHTLLPEALEKWPIELFRRLLPRHLEIIYEINQRFLNEVRERYPDDEGRVQRLSLIDESGERYIRMANLGCVGSHAINGVAELHTQLLQRDVLRDFYEMMPEKFSNKTNGITPRRFLILMLINPRLVRLINDAIGDGWIQDFEKLRGLEEFAGDSAFQSEWRQIKHRNKVNLAAFIEHTTDVAIDPSTMFDAHAKRIHESKRQHLNVLHVITLYNRLRKNSSLDMTPRTVLFAGKAAPGYFMAKLIIKLVNSVAATVNKDPDVAAVFQILCGVK